MEKPLQILSPEAELVGEIPAGVGSKEMLRWYRTMWLTRIFSNKAVALQRQGKGTTWIPSLGQEAAAVGMATPLEPQDWIAGSPREIGAYFMKGVPPAAIAYFCRGYVPPKELFGDAKNCLPLTIVIGTQTVHSAGLAMAAKIRGDKAVVVGSCGDGATSEGDFNEALNFAGVFNAPLVMVVVNNGWSISVPRSKQSAVEFLAERGPAFGIPAKIADGNDILAVHTVMKAAVARARAGEGPSLVELITYRRSAHSTADDPTRYCPPEELALWEKRDPIARFRLFLLGQGYLTEETDAKLVLEIEQEIEEQVKIAFEYPAPTPDSIFEQTFGEIPTRLLRQRETMRHEMKV